MAASTRDAIASPPDPTTIQLKQIAKGHEPSCRDLIDRWEKSITIIASRYVSRRSDLDDLVQVGRIAVYSAALRYQATKGYQFAHYAKRAIKNRVKQEADRLSRQRRCEIPCEGMHEDDSIDVAVLSGEKERVREWTRELPDPHATLFRLLYVEGLTQREAATLFGKSQPWVSQLHLNFLKLARVALAG